MAGKIDPNGPENGMAVPYRALDDRMAELITLPADARTSVMKSLLVTLSGTPGTITSITLPDNAQGFRMYSSADCQYAVGENPAALATSSDTTIAAAAFGVGGVAKASDWDVRLLNAGTARTLRIRSATASATVTVELF